MEMLEKIDQQWLKSFHCVYENNSFKRAAEFLSLPTSNVSRHIALLEEQLDVRLFDRTTRRICATDAGEHLYLRTQPLLDKLNDALEEVTQHSREVMGQLNIVMPDSPELAKAVVSFCAQYPAISLNCETNLSPKEDLLDGFDVMVSFHRGKLEDSNWIAKEIKRWPSVVVASPKLLHTRQRPFKITDLKHVPCISSFTAFKVNSGQLAKAGALAGFGFAILPVEFCHEEIESGDLEVIELEYEAEDLVLYAFYASRKHLAKKIPAFIEHLKRQANNETSG
ncbi:LysR family transcriptional regulator [Vibrio parahaemolyticus]|uniref:LysR family transcriptional regulator n=1 Tax=Vibrio parahaemolyticus TaxID=670 RepID=UPI0003F7496B|nr:LysR family transcriptional regulator [Vibrio parahaemolyticus]ANQ58364.1 LysR family transcriptional regulator [Vibrio parahaemolyticus]EGQ7713348.1 LysR family transcriptional regulator [Vibrio parahaemolyticus]EGQ7717690.1 LysR family transcriptional regulator [Vibrio parahaemolyticus]EGQ7724278.1 LysR family transcriptional regulator [Vibrio parahaemolyticus]EGQ7729650.1 LysR family transcriptional regulator [Vibrio parahaemolyticus]